MKTTTFARRIRYGESLPAGFAAVYREWDCDAVLAMRRPFHLLGRLYAFWRDHRWDAERAMVADGRLTAPAGTHLRDIPYPIDFSR